MRLTRTGIFASGFRVPLAVPDTPPDFNLNTVTATTIDMSWTAPAGSVTGYKIERESPSGSGWTVLVANTGNTNTTYQDTGLTPETEYSYRIIAINAQGESAPSSPETETTDTVPPPSFETVLISFGSSSAPAAGLTNWNLAHTNNPLNNYELLDLVNSLGATTGINLENDTTWNDANLGATTGSDSGYFPDNAMVGSWQGNSTTESIRFTGLDNGKTYSFKILCSKINGGPTDEQIVTANGQNPSSPVPPTYVNAHDNTTELIEFTNLSPVGGIIDFLWTDGTGVIVVNAIEITYPV
ncbi:MAG: fibronectin type III domain-containing protein [Bacteroidota bacterium]